MKVGQGFDLPEVRRIRDVEHFTLLFYFSILYSM